MISLLGQIAVGIIWTYFLYNCWNHSEHHLVQAGIPNPLGEATDLVTGHYIGWKGSGAIGPRLHFLDEVRSFGKWIS